MHKPESVQENTTHKILWDFERQTDDPIPARRSNQLWIRKKKKKNFDVPADHKVKIKEIEKIDKFLELVRELKI